MNNSTSLIPPKKMNRIEESLAHTGAQVISDNLRAILLAAPRVEPFDLRKITIGGEKIKKKFFGKLQTIGYLSGTYDKCCVTMLGKRVREILTSSGKSND